MPKSNLKLDFKLSILLLIAFFLRSYGLNWDQGLHLHPDERMLIFVADRINLFRNLNPDFFNYGSLPIYLLKGLSQLFEFISQKPLANYMGMLYLGRYLSVFFDCLTVLFIYKIGRLLFPDKRVGLLSSFVYTISFFPIQNTHFFTVDILLTSLITLFGYQLLRLAHRLSRKRLVLVGITFAAMMATKFTAVVFLPFVLFVIIMHAWNHWRNIIIDLLIFFFSFLIFGFVFMPYAFLDYRRFFSDTFLQTAMSRNAYLFPYTLQFVGSIPYWHYLKQIFLWGLGPFISVLSLIGLIKCMWAFRRVLTLKKLLSDRRFLFALFYFLYFLIIGISAVKFMRYMLPLYPFLAILAGYGLSVLENKKSIIQMKFIRTAFVIFSLSYTLLCINIYSYTHTRIQASRWILNTIPAGSSLAVEYWDDYLPLSQGDLYRFQELHLYDQPDNADKWQKIENQLNQSDYIIVASNRLYTPMQNLNNCLKYKVCYPIASTYYQKLFSGRLPFRKVREFAVYPSITIGPWKFELNDSKAEESFTVFDHPKIFIFKKMNIEQKSNLKDQSLDQN